MHILYYELFYIIVCYNKDNELCLMKLLFPYFIKNATNERFKVQTKQ